MCLHTNLNAKDHQLTQPELASRYSAQVRRTEFGIPHIQAADWGSLGYGFGYAYAQDSFCVAMREIVFATGRSAELMGVAEGDIETDFLFRFLNGDKDRFRREFVEVLPQFVQDLIGGFTRGMNRYLDETGVENLPEGDLGCCNAAWVYAFDEVDLSMFLRRETLRGGSDNGIFRRALLAVEGPRQPLENLTGPRNWPLIQRQLQQGWRPFRRLNRGSNGLALGSRSTQNGRGMLLGNPHQPWFGAGAWYQAHLTIPGIYDVAGAALQGLPFIAIGFNRDVAWTHSVSFANHLTLYELKLNPENPLQYDYDGEWREIITETVDIQVQLADGSLETRSKTFYRSHYGPIINLVELNPLLDGWPLITGSVLALRDANLPTGLHGVEQWIAKGQAQDLSQYVEAVKRIRNPVFHEMAADRNGDAFYGERSAIPFVTQAQLDLCINGLLGPQLAQATTNAVIALDGSQSACEWGTDPEAPVGSHLYAASALPHLLTDDYVSNSNNSYWLSNANQPLEGFPTIMGPVGHEGMQQFLRTRLGHVMVAERQLASDGLSNTPLFDQETLKGMMYANRVYAAEIVLDDILSICASEEAIDVQEACSVLAAWDRKVNLDSRGAQVFTEFWNAIRTEFENRFQNIVESDALWAVDFDPAAPLSTPAGIDTSIASIRDSVIAALTQATEALANANVPLDAPWGEVQGLERNGERISIHGGAGTMGVYGAISVELQDGGYINPTGGNSYIQVVSWDESECPIADVILVPSQSTDPASPHFADQTKLYADKAWVRFPFCEADISAKQIGDTLVLEE